MWVNLFFVFCFLQCMVLNPFCHNQACQTMKPVIQEGDGPNCHLGVYQTKKHDMKDAKLFPEHQEIICRNRISVSADPKERRDHKVGLTSFFLNVFWGKNLLVMKIITCCSPNANYKCYFFPESF